MTFTKILSNISIVLYLNILFSGCSIIDFSPGEEIETSPDLENQIIGENDKLWVDFKFDPEKISAESLFRINDYKGNCRGSISWEGSKMIFTPEERMTAGRRYTLDYSGTVKKKDGGEVNAEILIPFFFIEKGIPPPFICSENPLQGAVISRDQNVIFNFSKPMDTGSVKKGLSVEPETENHLSWNAANTVLTILPEYKWDNLSSYSFSFSPDICCIDSIPAEIEYCFIYYCDSSHLRPEIAAVNTVLDNITLAYPGISVDLNTIKFREGIEIKFSLDMNRDSVENSLTFTPYTAGRKIWKNNTSMIFIPENGWEWNKNYILNISETAESENDIAIVSEYSYLFTADIEEQILDSLDGNTEDGFPVSSYSKSTVIDIDTGDAQPYIYSFTYTFSEPFLSDQDKENTQSSINITSLFPPDTSSPFPVSYTWIGDRSLTVKYSGFIPRNSTDNIDYYYMLTIKGGPEGIINTEGSFMEETLNQILRTK